MTHVSCSHCGRAFPGDPKEARFCALCGAPLTAELPAPLPPAEAQKGKGLAIAALVVGICAFVPVLGIVCGLVAFVLGVVALTTNRRGQGLAGAGIACAAAGLVGNFTLVPPAIRKARGLAKQAICKHNLTGIDAALTSYTGDHDGAFPPDLETLVHARELRPEWLRCPSSREERACDYFYLPPSGVHAQNVFLVCDFGDNHPAGRCVLTADGTVQFLPVEQFERELAQPYNSAFRAALRRAEAVRGASASRPFP